MNNDELKIWMWFPLVLVACLCYINSTYAAVSAVAAKNIFIKMAPRGIVFSVLNSNVVQAESTSHELIVYRGMLKLVDNKDQLALVIGHELGHIANGDYNKPGTPTFDMEYAADLYGFNIANRYGYSACNGLKIFSKFSKLPKLNDRHSYAHPRDIDRYNRLVKYCK